MILPAYFSSQKVTPVAVPDDVVAAGKALYGGDTERGLAACTACHGPRGFRRAGEVPQPVGAASRLYQGPAHRLPFGDRDNDPNGMMRDVAKKLTDQDIEALSKWRGFTDISPVNYLVEKNREPLCSLFFSG